MPPPAGYDVVRILLGLVLLTAAGLKGYQLATEPTLEKGLLTSRWFLIGQVEFELALGIFLLSGLYKCLVWLMTLICFIGFSSATLYKALSGQISCGCFGRVEVSPWYTLTIDLLAIGCLAKFQPNYSWISTDFHLSKFMMLACLIFVIGLPTGYVMATYSPIELSDDGSITEKGNVVTLDPEKWIGGPFPLMKYTNTGKRFSSGTWIFVMYSYSCSTCRENMEIYHHWLRKFEGTGECVKPAFVEVSSIGHNAVDVDARSYSARPVDTNRWIIPIPLIVLLKDGKTVAVWRNIPEFDLVLGHILSAEQSMANEKKGGDPL